jgi:hypothetical protein
MLAVLLFGVAGAQFFQPPAAGFLSQGSMMSQAVPLVGNEPSLQQAVPYEKAREKGDYSAAHAVYFVVCALAVAGAAMRKPTARRAIAPSMVSWAHAPAELQWAEAAWHNLQLDAKDLGATCIYIPPEYGPDQSLDWYFCSTQASMETGVSCFPLPMQTAGRNVYICSMPRGARPSYEE